MVATPPVEQIRHSPQPPRLLVELPSRPKVFFGNLLYNLFPWQLSRLQLQSAPAPFWPDVFVERRLPWSGFLKSGAFHVIAIIILVGLAQVLSRDPGSSPSRASITRR